MFTKNKLQKTVFILLVVFIAFCIPVFASGEVLESPVKIPTTITWTNPTEALLGPFTGYVLTIKLTDNNGNPLSNKSISWGYPNNFFANQITTTDSDGITSNEARITHADRNTEYTANIPVSFNGDDTYESSSYNIILNCYDTGPQITSTPSPSRPATPGVKRTPGPTELDVISNISGYVLPDMNGNETSVSRSGFEINITGTGMRASSQNDGKFILYSVYNCGKLRISKPGYLSREIQLEQLLGKFGSPLNPNIEIFAGDLNQDDAINMTDIMEVAKCFNTSKGNEQFNEICDLNKDTSINMTDIMMIAKHFNVTSLDYKNLTPNYIDSVYKIDLTVEEAKQISPDSVYIKGAIYLMTNGSWPVTPVWIEYWEESNPTKVNRTDSDLIFYYPDFIERTIGGLKTDTTYKYRVNCGLSSSDIKSFHTLTDISILFN